MKKTFKKIKKTITIFIQRLVILLTHNKEFNNLCRWFSWSFVNEFYEELGYSLKQLGVCKIELKKSDKPNTYRVIFHTTSPGIFIGKGGRNVDKIQKILDDRCKNESFKLTIKIEEIDILSSIYNKNIREYNSINFSVLNYLFKNY